LNEQGLQCFNMARLGFPDIAEWLHVTQITDDLIISRPGVIFVVKRFLQNLDIVFRKPVHRSVLRVKNTIRYSDSAATRVGCRLLPD
jgi:hypothetical protein